MNNFRKKTFCKKNPETIRKIWILFALKGALLLDTTCKILAFGLVRKICERALKYAIILRKKTVFLRTRAARDKHFDED